MGRNNRILFMLVAAILYILLFYTSLMKKSNTDSGDDETYEDSTQQATANGQGFNFFGNFFKKQVCYSSKIYSFSFNIYFYSCHFPHREKHSKQSTRPSPQ